MTVDVQFDVVDAADVGQPRVHVRGRLLTAPFLLDDSEIAAPSETYSGAAGAVVLPLIPSSMFTEPGVYEIRFAGQRHLLSVPDVGPVNLAGTPLAGSGFGFGPFGSGPFGG